MSTATAQKGETTTTDFIKAATHTAHHFGFRPLEDVKDDTRCKNASTTDGPRILVAQRRLDALQGLLTSGACAYLEHNFHGLGEPALFYSIEETPRTGDIALSLQILGVEKSIAESLLIHTLHSLLHDLNLTEHSMRINSLGDRESLTRYSRELGNYLKKRLDIMPGQARELMKEHVLYALAHLIERGHELGTKSPSSLEYLNETSRKHFREIIEYLDFSNTPYEIDSRLLGHHQCYSQTLFAIDSYIDADRTEESNVSVRGGRYDEFIYHATKKNLPAVGAVVTFKDHPMPARVPRHKGETPLVYIVQLGFGPKLRSLALIEELKRAAIPVYQSLSSDSLTAQLEQARRHNVPLTVILGQKEFVENSVIVRDMRSSSQENVPLSNLVSYLRKTAHA